MNKALVIALASTFAAGSALAANIGHAPAMSRDMVKPMHQNAVMSKSRGTDDVAGDSRRGRGKDDLVFKSRGADNAAGDIRRGRGQDDLVAGRRGADDTAGVDRRGGRDDGPNHP